MTRKNSNQVTTNHRGFRKPTTTPTPDEIFDVWLSVLTPAELKILLYIVRRTFGFGKDEDAISLRQICGGIKTKDGRVLDRGTGLSRRAAFQAVQSLEKAGLITVDRDVAEDGVNQVNVYRLAFVEEESLEKPHTVIKEIKQGIGTKSTYGREEKYLGVGTESDPTTNSIQQTDIVVVNRLQKFKIGKVKAEELVGKFSPEYIEQKIQFLAWKLETKPRGRPVSDPAAWLIQAIERDYSPPPSFKTKAEQAQEAGELAREEAKQEKLYEERREQERERQIQHMTALQKRFGTTDKEIVLWAQVLKGIELATTKPTYQTWFPDTLLLSLEDGHATIGVPNQIAKDRLSGRLSIVIQRALEDVVGQSPSLTFEVLETK